MAPYWDGAAPSQVLATCTDVSLLLSFALRGSWRAPCLDVSGGEGHVVAHECLTDVDPEGTPHLSMVTLHARESSVEADGAPADSLVLVFSFRCALP